VISDEHRKVLWTKNGLLASALVDGTVAATWKIVRDRKSATLTIDALRRIARKDRAELVEEAERLLAFTDAELSVRTVRFVSAR
jgi:hypothetical protein